MQTWLCSKNSKVIVLHLQVAPGGLRIAVIFCFLEVLLKKRFGEAPKLDQWQVLFLKPKSPRKQNRWKNPRLPGSSSQKAASGNYEQQVGGILATMSRGVQLLHPFDYQTSPGKKSCFPMGKKTFRYHWDHHFGYLGLKISLEGLKEYQGETSLQFLAIHST